MSSLWDILKKTTLSDTVDRLMTPGLAMPFHQDWYIPLPTTPESTGMSIGGIGSSVTITPAATTPVFNFIPGLQVRAGDGEHVRLSNFYYRERSDGDDTLHFADYAAFKDINALFPLKDASGRLLFDNTADEKKSIDRVYKVIASSDFWEVNRESFKRWQVFLNPATLRLEAATDRPAFHRALLLDFFQGSLAQNVEAWFNLTGDWNEKEIAGATCYPCAQMKYSAYFPVSITDYRGHHGVEVSRAQYTGIVPGDEKWCSLPSWYTVFKLVNNTSETREITLLQTQENMCGWSVTKERPGVQDASFLLLKTANRPRGDLLEMPVSGGTFRGIAFGQHPGSDSGDLKGRMAIGVVDTGDPELSVACMPEYYSCQEAEVVKNTQATGHLHIIISKKKYTGKEPMSGAVSATLRLAPGAVRELVFVSVLDFPAVDLFQTQKKYTSFFGDSASRLEEIVACCAASESSLREKVLSGQDQIVSIEAISKLMPDAHEARKFATLAMNTISFIPEATVWDTADRFLMRECVDYPFFNSLDVYFYGSFGLLKLLPRLDGAVMRDFSRGILADDSRVRRFNVYVERTTADLHHEKYSGPRATRGAVIHDLGSPFDPLADAYDWHNVQEWKDLAPKFVLMVWRHYKVTGDVSVLKDCLEAVNESMRFLSNLVEPGQLLPLTRGTDDTFDNLSSHGISVYCGTLWIAGLRAQAAILRELKLPGADDIDARADAASKVLVDSLYDQHEGYFRFYVTPITVGDVVENAEEKLHQLLTEMGVQCDGGSLDQLIEALNGWLNHAEQNGRPHEANRRDKKTLLYQKGGAAIWNESFHRKCTLDSDDIFADQLLADTYLKLLGLSPIASIDQKNRSLKKVVEMNFKANSPHIGAANLVKPDGSPLSMDNFQAHDVWTGVNYSIITALVQQGIFQDARDLLSLIYHNLYLETRIPFAAPEGFNGTCPLKPAAVMGAFRISFDKAIAIIIMLQKKKVLHSDNRISRDTPTERSEFDQLVASECESLGVEPNALYDLVHGTAIKYTAGKYLRPGMVFAILDALRLQ